MHDGCGGSAFVEDLNDALWRAFQMLASEYPDDNGVRMTADLERWLREQRQRLPNFQRQLREPPAR
jgi:hypothetical protein